MDLYPIELPRLKPVQSKATSVIAGKPCTIWIFGPTSSGKTTIANALLKMMQGMGEKAILYDGDEIRDIFFCDFGFTENDRLRVVNTLIHFANKTTRAGVFSIVSALTANQSARDSMRSNLDTFVDVFLDCPIRTCIERDPKGIYRKAIKGEIDTVIGYNLPYLKSKKACLKIDTSSVGVDEAAKCIMNYLDSKKLGLQK
jgi:adenylylsulfate kinase-like enzyme